MVTLSSVSACCTRMRWGAQMQLHSRTAHWTSLETHHCTRAGPTSALATPLHIIRSLRISRSVPSTALRESVRGWVCIRVWECHPGSDRESGRHFLNRFRPWVCVSLSEDVCEGWVGVRKAATPKPPVAASAASNAASSSNFSPPKFADVVMPWRMRLLSRKRSHILHQRKPVKPGHPVFAHTLPAFLRHRLIALRTLTSSRWR